MPPCGTSEASGVVLAVSFNSGVRGDVQEEETCTPLVLFMKAVLVSPLSPP